MPLLVVEIIEDANENIAVDVSIRFDHNSSAFIGCSYDRREMFSYMIRDKTEIDRYLIAARTVVGRYGLLFKGSGTIARGRRDIGQDYIYSEIISSVRYACREQDEYLAMIPKPTNVDKKELMNNIRDVVNESEVLSLLEYVRSKNK